MRGNVAQVLYLCELTRLQHANQRVGNTTPRRFGLNISARHNTRVHGKPVGLERLHRVQSVLPDPQQGRRSLGIGGKRIRIKLIELSYAKSLKLK